MLGLKSWLILNFGNFFFIKFALYKIVKKTSEGHGVLGIRKEADNQLRIFEGEWERGGGRRLSSKLGGARKIKYMYYHIIALCTGLHLHCTKYETLNKNPSDILKIWRFIKFINN